MLLDVRDLDVYYGAIHALQGISFHMEPGEIVTLIGANGAGKSTTLRTISGLIRPRRGTVTFKSQEISRTAAERIVRLGINHVPEGRKIFAPLTVLENLEMGAYIRNATVEAKKDLKMVFDYFPRLKEREGQLAGTLSGGEQQMLAIGRALMSRPKMLLLDEPSMGLAPIMVQKIFEVVRAVAADGMTILLIEQNARLALQCSQRGYVMESGEITHHGDSAQLLDDPKVRAAYLGE